MILEIFVIGVAFGVICLYLGYTQYSFPMAYLGMFIFMIMGMMLLSGGLQIQDALKETAPGTFTQTYVTHMPATDPVVNVVANTFFYIPIVGVFLSIFFALRGW